MHGNAGNQPPERTGDAEEADAGRRDEDGEPLPAALVTSHLKFSLPYRALFTLRFQHASRQLQNYRELRNAKRKIARLRTLKRERQIEAILGEE